MQAFTEHVLTRRKKRLLTQKMKQQAKHWLRDWAEAILWAVCMVLLINQYLFQMYRIPSGSMSGTLEVGDIFATGTPSGVGAAHPLGLLKVGDVVEVGIEKIGSIKNRVVAEKYPFHRFIPFPRFYLQRAAFFAVEELIGNIYIESIWFAKLVSWWKL